VLRPFARKTALPQPSAGPAVMKPWFVRRCFGRAAALLRVSRQPSRRGGHDLSRNSMAMPPAGREPASTHHKADDEWPAYPQGGARSRTWRMYPSLSPQPGAAPLQAPPMDDRGVLRWSPCATPRSAAGVLRTAWGQRNPLSSPASPVPNRAGEPQDRHHQAPKDDPITSTMQSCSPTTASGVWSRRRRRCCFH